MVKEAGSGKLAIGFSDMGVIGNLDNSGFGEVSEGKIRTRVNSRLLKMYLQDFNLWR